MGFFDWGRNLVNSLPVVGGLTSQLWGDPDQEAMQDAFKQSQQDLAKQRAYNMDARMNAMKQGALAFGQRNQMLGQMMGQRGPNAQAMDLGPMLQNPMSPAQQQDIRSSAFGDPDRNQINGPFPQAAPSPNTPIYGGDHGGMGTIGYYGQRPRGR